MIRTLGLLILLPIIAVTVFLAMWLLPTEDKPIIVE